jgi:hypothetical protein
MFMILVIISIVGGIGVIGTFYHLFQVTRNAMQAEHKMVQTCHKMDARNR